MSSQEWLIGAGGALALAALFYIFRYLYYFDYSKHQSNSNDRDQQRAGHGGARTHHGREEVASGSTVKPDVTRTMSYDEPFAAVRQAASREQSATTETRAAPADLKRASAGSRHHDPRTHEGGSPWYARIAGVATLLAFIGALAFYKGETVKVAVIQSEDAQKAVKAVIAEKLEAATNAAQSKIAAAKAEIGSKVVADIVVPKIEMKADADAKKAPAEEPAEEAPAAAAPEAPAGEKAAPAAAPVPGVTNYYGVSDGSRIMAWAAEAVPNPDYAAAEAAAPAEAEAPADVVAAAEEPAPAAPAAVPANANAGITSYYGIAETPDVEQSWAAEAEMNPDYEQVAEETAEAEAPATATEEAAPESLGGHGVTSYYGDGQTPDAGQTWAAAATMNAEYTVAEAAVEVAAPVSLGGQGVTSYYGDGQTPDAGKPWAAEATVYAQPAEEAPAPVSLGGQGVTSLYGGESWMAPANYYAPVESCSDQLAAALKSGRLNFATSSWEILPDSFKTLDKIAALAKDCNGASIEVGGHTDNTGRPESNKTLSEFRAQAVVKYLTGAGVDAGKLKAVGYGQEKPIADNDSTEGRRENRRIEFGVTTN